MPITRISHQGRSWPINEFVDACISGDCPYPATVAATTLDNAALYNNAGTVSGSALHAECDYKRLLEKNLDYTQEISDLYWASFRGSLVHGSLESCRNNPKFKDWLFENRYYAVLWPDDSFTVLDGPEKNVDGSTNWGELNARIAEIRSRGGVVLSGQIDFFNGRRAVLGDNKTARLVGEFTTIKESWQQQLTMYRFLLELHGITVKGIEVVALDAGQAVVRTAVMVDLDAWVKGFFIPRARQLDAFNQIPGGVIQSLNEGEFDWPAEVPLPVVNYLCNAENKTRKVYCALKSQCIAWRTPVAAQTQAVAS